MRAGEAAIICLRTNLWECLRNKLASIEVEAPQRGSVRLCFLGSVGSVWSVRGVRGVRGEGWGARGG